MKYGAFGPCPECEKNSSENMGFDLAFSSHSFPPGTLSKIGAVIREINAHCDEPDTRQSTFLYYMSTNYPQVMKVEIFEDKKKKAEEVLKKCHFEKIDFEKSVEPVAVMENVGIDNYIFNNIPELNQVFVRKYAKKILELLVDGPMTSSELEERIGKKVRSEELHFALIGLVVKGKIEHCPGIPQKNGENLIRLAKASYN